MTKLRTIAVVAIAAGTFGGTVGALAASAVQSEASPEAIAAAVQKVSDSSAEQSLRGIHNELTTIDSTLNANLNTNGTDGTHEPWLRQINSNLIALAHGLGINGQNNVLYGVAHNIYQTCFYASGNQIGPCRYAP